MKQFVRVQGEKLQIATFFTCDTEVHNLVRPTFRVITS